MGAQGVRVLSLALPAQCQEQELRATPGEVRGADGAGAALGTPSPLPTALGAHLRCPLHWVPPPCPALLFAWGGLGAVGARAGGPGAAGELSPFPWQPPGAHVQSGDFSRSRWSRKE